jgi:16S rRNA (cytidine1402-2'-O)-methyltransferase
MSVKILMVCLGNICRSPLAEGLLASKLPKDLFFVDSAGTGNWHVGKQPDDRAIAVAKKNKLDISLQKGRHFKSTDLDTFDYIYVMDNSNYNDVISQAKSEEQKSKVKLILNELFPGENVDVPDPYYGLQNGFDSVFTMLDKSCEVIAEKLITKYSKKETHKTTLTRGKLYLIPTTLGESDPLDVLPLTIKRAVDFIDDYIVENEKTARKFIKSIHPEKVQASLRLSALNKHTLVSEHNKMIQPCLEGKNIGLMSEAGCPGIADPGAVIVKLAHEKNIQVIPLVGPSSILLALMASGMNGQNFAFNGYLPIDKAEKKTAIKNLEKLSQDKNQSQIFIETPFRNNKMLDDILQALQPNTHLCVAADITLPSEYIKTMRVSDWKKATIDLHNRPTIFIIHKS